MPDRLAALFEHDVARPQGLELGARGDALDLSGVERVERRVRPEKAGGLPRFLRSHLLPV